MRVTLALLALAVFGVASGGIIAGPTTLLRAPKFDSAVIQSDRLGGNFAYSTAEAHAYEAINPVVENVVQPVAVSYQAHSVVLPHSLVAAPAVVAAPAPHVVAAPTLLSAPVVAAHHHPVLAIPHHPLVSVAAVLPAPSAPAAAEADAAAAGSEAAAAPAESAPADAPAPAADAPEASDDAVSVEAA